MKQTYSLQTRLIHCLILSSIEAAAIFILLKLLADHGQPLWLTAVFAIIAGFTIMFAFDRLFNGSYRKQTVSQEKAKEF